jgi:hypothetical protein
MASSATASLLAEKQGNNDNPGSWDTHLNTALDVIDSAIGGTHPVSTTGGSTTLTDAQFTDDEAKKAVLDVTGALTTNATIVIPNRSRLYRVFNRTTEGGSNTTGTIKTASGSGITVTRGSVALIYCTGSDTVRYAGAQAVISTGAVTGVLTSSDIGSTVQAYDADLTTWAGLTPSANAQSFVTAANYAAMRALLDLEAGTDFYSIAGANAAFQPLDADLTALAGLSSAADKVPYFTGSGTASVADFTASGRSMVGAASAAAQTALLSVFVGDSGSGGAKGLVPATVSGDSTKFLRGDATWVAIPGGGDALTSGSLAQFASTTSDELRGVISNETGTGALVFATSPTLVTPALGTPSSGTLTSCTGLPVSSGISGLGSNVATFLATPSSANLAAALTDETGSGAAVFATSPTLVTPILGTPTSGDLQNCTASTATTRGVVELATDAEAQTGTDTARALTAANLTAAGLKQGKRTLYIHAVSFTPRTTNGPAQGLTELATNDVMLRTLDFDQTTEEGAGILYWMPKSYNGSTVTFQPIWTAAAGSGGVVWSLGARAFANDDALDQAMGTAQTSTDTLIATGDMHVGPESSAITIAGTPAAEVPVYFEIRRVVGNGSDTLTGDAKLIGIKIFVTLNAATDA